MGETTWNFCSFKNPWLKQQTSELRKTWVPCSRFKTANPQGTQTLGTSNYLFCVPRKHLKFCVFPELPGSFPWHLSSPSGRFRTWGLVDHAAAKKRNFRRLDRGAAVFLVSRKLLGGPFSHFWGVLKNWGISRRELGVSEGHTTPRYYTILLDDAYFGWKIEKDPILIGKLKGASFRGGETA